MPNFVCQECHKDFEISDAILSKFPGWQPKRCFKCKKPASTSQKQPSKRTSREENLTLADALEKYSGGPKSGVFTDGSADPNPGSGGWGAVYVKDDHIVAQDYGHEKQTTNNRMELTALIAGCKLVPVGTSAVIYSDSELCVKTITIWAKGWESRDWKKKGGEIKNLDLVRELYGIFEDRSELELKWIQAHAGNRWNEYADSLATAYRRSTL
jgi:ribonuclease HI